MPVRCVECGYLALRRMTTRGLFEVEEEIRENGKIPVDVESQHPNQALYDPPLICFRRAFPLHLEQNQNSTSMGPEDRFLAVINKLRPCDKFIGWEQGFTPKDHYEMFQEAARLKWQEEQVEKARRHENRTLLVSLLAVVVAVVGPLFGAYFTKQPQVNVFVQPETPAAAPTLAETGKPRPAP